MKKMIGLVPKGILFEKDESNFSDVYQYGNNYAKCISDAGCIPGAVLPVDAEVSEEALGGFDGFVIMGGSKIWPYHLQIMHHAVTYGKPVLGICLGMQLIHCYFKARDIVEAAGYTGDLGKAITEAFYSGKLENRFLSRVPGHMSQKPPRGEEDTAKHIVSVVPGTHLEKLVGRSTINGATFHNWRVFEPSGRLTVCAYSTDGTDTVEAVEYGDKILGVQFHPEVDSLLPELFSFLAD